MSKRTAFIIIITLVVLIVGGLLIFYFYTNRGQGNGIVPVNNQPNIFPITPDGQNTNQNSTDNQPITSGAETSGIPAVLRELSTKPSAGAVAIATSSSVLVRFVEKGTGNVYEVSPEKSGETRLSNTTIPRITSVLWDNTGLNLIARYTSDDEPDTVQSYSAKLTMPKLGQTDGSLSGAFLTENISGIEKNPDQNKIFYIVNHSGGSSGVTSDFDGTKKTQIFDSPLKEWLVDWPSASTVALTTKPSAGIPGFLYFLNTKTGALTRAIAGIKGLTALINPDASLALYSESINTDLTLKIYSFSTGSSVDMSITTLPEKCIWSKNDSETIFCSVPSYLPQGIYPDSWYKGLVSFSDDIWKVDAKRGTGKLLARLKDLSRTEIDGTKLFLDPKENYLFFTNKNDSHLWSLRLNNQ